MQFSTYLLVLAVIASLTTFNEAKSYKPSRHDGFDNDDYDLDQEYNSGGYRPSRHGKHHRSHHGDDYERKHHGDDYEPGHDDHHDGGNMGDVCYSNRSCPPTSPDCCSKKCTSIDMDAKNCGACNNKCPDLPNSTPSCTGSVCGSTCDTGFGNCDNNQLNGCESNLQTSPTNCGSCGTTCPANPNSTPGCAAGVCSNTCNTGFGDCDANTLNGCETDLTTTTNCGACGTTCTANPNSTPSCTGGLCANTCNVGFGDCDANVANGCETNLLTDPLSCGTCGTPCNIPLLPNTVASCLNGVCSLTCALGFTDCNNDLLLPTGDGCESNLLTSVTNCGTCGNDCSVLGLNLLCQLGVCVDLGILGPLGDQIAPGSPTTNDQLLDGALDLNLGGTTPPPVAGVPVPAPPTDGGLLGGLL